MRLLPHGLAGMPPRADGMRPRAVFIDKDGTLVEDVPYNVDPDLLRLTEGAARGLRRLAAAGYLLVVVSNQAGLALGRFDVAALDRLACALVDLLAAQGVALTAFHVCPHAASAADALPACGCRKPRPGLLQEAALDWHIDLARSWMVGDILDDVEAGKRAGCRTVLMDVGNETMWKRTADRVPDIRVRNLAEAADAILAVVSQEAGTDPPTSLPDIG